MLATNHRSGLPTALPSKRERETEIDAPIAFVNGRFKTKRASEAGQSKRKNRFLDPHHQCANGCTHEKQHAGDAADSPPGTSKKDDHTVQEPAGVEHNTVNDMTNYAAKSMENDINTKNMNNIFADKDMHNLIKKLLDELLAPENHNSKEKSPTMPTLSSIRR